jgi:hypothetical protein
MNLCYKNERLCSRRRQASKSRTSEEHKKISPMHECSFSLNMKCRNTYFTLIEDSSIRIYNSISILNSNLDTHQERPLLWKEALILRMNWCVSKWAPSPSIYRQVSKCFSPLFPSVLAPPGWRKRGSHDTIACRRRSLRRWRRKSGKNRTLGGWIGLEPCAGLLNRTEKKEKPRVNHSQPREASNQSLTTTPGAPRIPVGRPARPHACASASRWKLATGAPHGGRRWYPAWARASLRRRITELQPTTSGHVEPPKASHAVGVRQAAGWRHTDVSIGHYFLHLISFASELRCR